MARLGDLERAVMEHLWATPDAQTVRQVHASLSRERDLAYTTVMTVLQRLTKKRLVIQERHDRAFRYRSAHRPEALVADLMFDAFSQANAKSREAALVHFVDRVTPDDAAALRKALERLSKTSENGTVVGDV